MQIQVCSMANKRHLEAGPHQIQSFQYERSIADTNKQVCLE